MEQKHSIFYKNCPSTYKVNIFSDKSDLPIASFCCAYCKMWLTCDDESNVINCGHKRDVCYIAHELEQKISPFICGASHGFSDTSFVLYIKNDEQRKSIDKIRKHLLKKYKMR